jgi:hypothetical protein
MMRNKNAKMPMAMKPGKYALVNRGVTPDGNQAPMPVWWYALVNPELRPPMPSGGTPSINPEYAHRWLLAVRC